MLLSEYLSTSVATLGDTLETALEHGEKYEEFVSDCKAVKVYLTRSNLF